MKRYLLPLFVMIALFPSYSQAAHAERFYVKAQPRISISENNQSFKNSESQKLAQDNRNDRNYNNNRPNNRNDRNYNDNRPNNRNDRNYNNNRPRSFSRLPNGYRKFVSRNKTYYTNDNRAYYSYSPASRAYVLINLPGFSIIF